MVHQQVVQKDWEDREFNESVKLSLAKIVQFLNKFGEPSASPMCASAK